MARGDIKIPIAVDTGGVQKAIVNGLIEPIEDAEDALKKLEKTDAGRDIERSMERAQDSTEDLSRELDVTRRDLDKLSFAAKDAGDAGSSGMDRIKGGAQEVQREVGANLGEAVSSIRGDFSDLGQVGQDTLGGLAATVAGMGPAGLVGALALAAGAMGLGAVTAGIDDAKKKQEELNKLVSQFAEGYIAGAGQMMSASAVLAEYTAISTDPERYAEAKKAAGEWGVETGTAMRALAGDTTALTLVQESLDKRVTDANDSMSEAERNVGGLGDAYSSLPEDIKAGQERLDLINEAMGTAKGQASDYASGLYDLAIATGNVTDETDDLGNKIVKLPDGKEIVIDAETQTAYEDIDALEQRKLADKRVTLTVDDSAIASAMTRWANWRPAQKTAYVNYVTNGGTNHGGL